MNALRYAVVLALIPVAIVTTSLSARDSATNTPRQLAGQRAPAATSDLSLGAKASLSGIPIDTFVLAEYTFDGVGGVCDPQGWTSIDLTAPTGTYFHVDDFAGMNGGTFGRLTPLEGNQSLWCGTRADSTSEYFCSYAMLPGYGNNWDQRFVSVPFPAGGDVTLTYNIRWNTEPAYDYIYVAYRDTSSNWIRLAEYTDIGDTVDSRIIPDSSYSDSLQVRFRFLSDGAFSDEDGMWDTDGAVIIDSVTVTDSTGVIDYQDFESEIPGATGTSDGNWQAEIMAGYGDFAGLFQGVYLVQEDPCISNLSCMWGFFKGSTYDFSCGGFPQQPTVPYENDRGQAIENEIRSPWIDWSHDRDGAPVSGTAALAYFQFDVYTDMPLKNMITYVWYVRSKVDGCPTIWRGDNFYHHGPDYPEWRINWDGRVEVAQLVEPDATDVQLAIRTIDVCKFFCGQLGSGDCHSHSPLIDNVRLIRLDYPGPIFDARDISPRLRNMHLFQDNFSYPAGYTHPGTGEYTAPGRVRIDIGYDTNQGNAAIVLGDSLIANITEPTYGLDRDVSGGPAAYIHVRDLPGKAGADLSGGPQWPYVPSLSGSGWTVIRMDSVPLTFYPQDQYCVDLNDNLFEPGDTILYYLSARDAIGRTTYWTRLAGATGDQADVQTLPMEMTCLPANGLNGTTDILYVDAHDGGGTQPYFDYDFGMLGITPDRFDINQDGRDQGLASAVRDVALQLIPYYRKIIWSSGSLENRTIGDGSQYSNKSDDFGVLYEFVDQHPEDCGVYFTGDGLAYEWYTWLSGAGSTDFRSNYMDFIATEEDHRVAGLPVSPLVVAQAGSFFNGIHGPDSLVAFGGCPTLKSFDVLAPTGNSTLEMAYADNPGHGAVIAQQSFNADSAIVGVVLSGFDYAVIRDDRANNPYDRVVHLQTILVWLGNVLPYPTAAESGPAFRNELAQNYPNPFNPTTQIRYSVKASTHVSLRVYNVAGQLVKSLVDDIRIAGPHTVMWDGRNNGGAPVASGVYFYRLVAGDFTKTRKLTVLK